MTEPHSDAPDAPCTTLRLPFAGSSVSLARRRMVSELAGHGLRETFIDDAQLVLGELGANGIEHGEPDAEGQITISWCIADDLVTISVCDGGGPATLRPITFSDAGLRGRGLAIVDHLSSTWSVEHDSGLRVTAELRHTR